MFIALTTFFGNVFIISLTFRTKLSSVYGLLLSLIFLVQCCLKKWLIYNNISITNIICYFMTTPDWYCLNTDHRFWTGLLFHIEIPEVIFVFGQIQNFFKEISEYFCITSVWVSDNWNLRKYIGNILKVLKCGTAEGWGGLFGPIL
jgi:hypothetical protein